MRKLNQTANQPGILITKKEFKIHYEDFLVG